MTPDVSTPDLFVSADARRAQARPLAERMRPTRLEDIVGQPHLIGARGILTQLLKAGHLPSCIFSGPPGSGKTTLAHVLARGAHLREVHLSALSAGVREVREALEQAAKERAYTQRATMLFIDEIHRFHRGQQDALLAAVERGDVVFVGATTENPQVTVNRALLSRCRLFALRSLDDAAMQLCLDRGLADLKKNGAVGDADSASRLAILHLADGDVRRALGLLELSSQLANQDRSSNITADHVARAQQPTALSHARQSDAHFDLTSALIKSMRASNSQAAIYYLARLLEAGEDVAFVGRRLMIFASEDIGPAGHGALGVAVAAHQAASAVGMPEARLPLTQAVMCLAEAKKSRRAIDGYTAAAEAVHRFGAQIPPAHLRNRQSPTEQQDGPGPKSCNGDLPSGVWFEEQP